MPGRSAKSKQGKTKKQQGAGGGGTAGTSAAAAAAAAAAAKQKKARKGKRREDDEYGGGGGYYTGRNPLQKPPDQEILTDLELKEEIPKLLTTDDPQKLKNLMIWDYNQKEFLPVEETDEKMITVFFMESELIAKDSEEANEFKGELIDEFSDPEVDDVKKPEPPKEEFPEVIIDENESKEDKLFGDEDEDDDKEEEVVVKPKVESRFIDRAEETIDEAEIATGSQTDPPSMATYRDMCNLWIIYDAYQLDAELNPVVVVKKRVGGDGEGDEEGGGGEDAAEKEKEKEEMKPKEEPKKKDRLGKIKMRKPEILEGQAAVDMALLSASEGLKYMERLVNSNMHDEVVDDFKYFEDNADEYRETGEGTLLPLWKFSYDRAKKMHATCISWSITQPDMCAVSYGSFSFIYPILEGMVVIYTLKNPSYPEHAWLAPKGAMTCHVHPGKNMLVCVGLYDGNTAVLNIEKNEANESRTEIYKNLPTLIKHSGAVWSVKWNEDDLDGAPTFYSAGMDGRVILWRLGVQDVYGNGGLEGSEVCRLFLPVPALTGPDGTTYRLYGCARCLAFHPKDRNTFLVGTAEGNIFQCSALYSSRFEKLYSAHFLPVAALQWNHFHFDVFLSCSEDWTIKIWDRRDTQPMYIFEIGVPILDACWAPYSSTVFGAVTEEGKVIIFDLNINKEKPICTQQVVTKKKVRPHRIQFNPIYPIVIVADDRGQLSSLKLSPNLRIFPKDSNKNIIQHEGEEAREKFEVDKMVKLLSIVRDPEGVTKPKEIPEATDLEHSGQPIISIKC